MTALILSPLQCRAINGTGDGDTAPDWTIVDAHHAASRARGRRNRPDVHDHSHLCGQAEQRRAEERRGEGAEESEVDDPRARSYVASVRDDEWITTGPHRFVDCWCGHGEPFNAEGKTLDFRFDRTHQWVNLGCPPACPDQTRVHGHVHIHCPDCARNHAVGTCCTPATTATAATERSSGTPPH